MKTHQLDDAKLSGLFAEKVAGLKNITIKAIVNPRIEHYTYSAPTKDNPYLRLPIPSFATSADAVLPWLEKRHPWRADCCGEYGVMVQVWRGPRPDGICYEIANAPTFARAACIALIRAKRLK